MIEPIHQKILEASFDILPHVRPLYWSPNAVDFEYAGSSTLVNIGEYFFILTAAHVVENRDYFFLSPGKEDENMVFIRSKWRYCRGNFKGTDKDRIDLAFSAILPETAEKLNVATFWNMERNSISDQWKSSHNFTFIGYPCSRNKPNNRSNSVISSPFGFTNDEIEFSEYQKYDSDPTSHIVVEFDKDRCIDANENKRPFPEPIGMSGGGVWEWFIDDISAVTPKVRPKLVGLIVERAKRNRQERWIGTRVELVLEGMRRTFRELRPLIPISDILHLELMVYE